MLVRLKIIAIIVINPLFQERADQGHHFWPNVEVIPMCVIMNDY